MAARVLLARAFVFDPSPRALLAVSALGLSVAYAIVAAAALAGLGGDAATLAEADADPGFALHRPGLEPFPAAQAPAGAVLLYRGTGEGFALATLVPYPLAADEARVGPYADEPTEAGAWLAGLNFTDGLVRFGPADAILLPPERFFTLVPGAADAVHVAYVAGASPPHVAGLVATPWRGVAMFYDEGAAQVRTGLGAVVLSSGFIAAFLSAGFVHLEILARRPDFDTLEALAGPRLVRRMVLARTAALVVAGLVAGTVVALAVVRVAAAAVGPDAFALDPLALVATWLVVGVGGIAAGALAGLRVLARRSGHAQHRSMMGVRRFPGRIRFLLVTPRVFLGLFAATLVTTTILAAVLQTAAVPHELFGSGSEVTVLVGGEGNPLRGSVGRFLAENAQFLEGVDSAVAETYAPTVLAGRPLLVKGVNLDAWKEFRSPRLAAGGWPDLPDEATLGTRAARVHDIDVGDVVVLPHPYEPGVSALTVVGFHETDGLEDDELLTSLDAAGALAGLPPERVTMARVRLADARVPWNAVTPGDGIEIVRIHTEPEEPTPLAPFTVVVDAINFADRDETRTVSVRLDGNVSAADRLAMAPHSHLTTRYTVIAPEKPRFLLEVNPTQSVGVATPLYRVEAPSTAAPNQSFRVAVVDADGAPVAAAEILLDGQAFGQTDAEGLIDAVADTPRLLTITARTPEGAAGAVVRIADPDWWDKGVLVVEQLVVERPIVVDDAHARVRAFATVANVGGDTHNTHVPWRLDGTNATTSDVTLASATRATFSATFTVDFGDHALEFVGVSRAFSATAADIGTAAGPTSVEEVLARKRSDAESAGGRFDPAGAFLEQVFGSLTAATSVVVLVTVLHGGVLVWVSVRRELAERRAVAGLLAELGASDAQVEGRALRDTLLSALLPLAAGSAVALGALATARWFGVPAAFGHALPTAGAAGTVWRGALVLLVVAIAAAYSGVHRGPVRRTEAPAPRSLARWMEALR